MPTKACQPTLLANWLPLEAMNPDAALAAACHEWRALASAEGDAIHSRDWASLARCQNEIAKLQERIAQLRETTACNSRGPHASLIPGLLSQERRNLAALDTARAELQQQFNDLDQSRLNLLRIQRSYSAARPAAWNSYS